MGALLYNLPFKMPKGVNNQVANISLSYNSSTGGGFSLSGISSISRCPTKKDIDGFNGTINYDSDDRFCLDGKRLITNKDSSFSTELNDYSKVVAFGDSTNPDYWQIWKKDSSIFYYGKENNSTNIHSNGKTVTWFLSRQQDRFNNKIDYLYKKVYSLPQIEQITYSNHKIKFEYQDNGVNILKYKDGRAYLNNQELKNITIHTNGVLKRLYKLSYQKIANNQRRLTEVTLCDANNNCLKPTKFTYYKKDDTDPTLKEQIDIHNNNKFLSYHLIDVTGDGRNNICYYQNKNMVCDGINSPIKHETDWFADQQRLKETINSLDFVDINFDGLPDYCLDTEQGLACADNLGNLRFSNIAVRSSYGATQIKRTFDYWQSETTIVEYKPKIKTFFYDINQDNFVDLCKISSDAIDCALNDKQGFFINSRTVKTNISIKNPKTAFLVDINADSLPDICSSGDKNYFGCYLNTSKKDKFSFSDLKIWSSYHHFNSKNKDVKNSLRMTDFNNDGLPDACYYYGSFIYCAINNGYQFVSINTISSQIANGYCSRKNADSVIYYEQNPDHHPFVPDPDKPYLLQPQTTVYYCNGTPANNDEGWGATPAKRLHTFNMIDINHDGFVDACFMPEDGVLSCSFGDGANISHMQKYAVFNPLLAEYKLADIGRVAVNAMPIRYSDINSDAKIDICYRSTSGISCAIGDIQGGVNLLKSVTTAYNKSEFEYGNLSDDNNYIFSANTNEDGKSIKPSMRVLTKVITNNAAGTTNFTSYRYQDLRLHKKYGIRSFAKIFKTTNFNNKKTISSFHQSKRLNGKIKESQIYINEQLIDDTSYQYQLKEQANKVYQILTTNTISKSYDLNGMFLKTKSTIANDFNKYGDAREIIERIEDKTTTDFYQITTHTKYYNNIDDYIIGKPLTITVTHQTNNATPITKTIEINYNNIGAVDNQTVQPSSELALTTSYQYDKFGNKISKSITDRNGKTRTTLQQYDDDGLNPIKISNALGQSIYLKHDDFCQKPIKKIDLNGLITTYQYDSLCRLTNTYNPDGTTANLEYQFAEKYDLGVDNINTSEYKIISKMSGKNPITTYYDGLKNKTRIKKIGFDNKQIILQDWLYNKRGLIQQTTLPYYQGLFAGDNTSWIKFSYDVLGRKMQQISPSKTQPKITSYSYDGYSTTITDAMGFNKTITKNIQNKTTKVIATDGDIITNEYDAIGNLVKVAINGNVTEKISYDKMGNKIRMQDKSMGRWSYTYNAFGELITQTDAKGQTTTNHYDKIGRLIKKEFAGGTNTFVYDTAANGIGKLHKSISDAKEQILSYDEYGRLHNTTTKIQDNEYQQNFFYDKYSRLIKTVHPNDVHINRNYNKAGFLKSISMPKKQVWTPDLIGLESVMKIYMQKAQELGKKASEYEEQALKYIKMASRARSAFEHLTRVANSQQNYANSLRHYASINDRYAAYWLRQASYMRSNANYYYRTVGDRYMRLISVSGNGWARYYYSKRVSRGKGSRTYRYNWYLKGFFSRYSYPRYLHIGRLFNKYAARYTSYANNNKRSAQYKRARANVYDNLAKENYKKAQSFKNQALSYYQIASFYTTKMQQLKTQSDNLFKATTIIADNVQRYQDEVGDKQIMLWSVTNKDASDRIIGQVYANGVLTQHEYDNQTGHLNKIVSQRGDKIIRNLNFSYNHNNSLIKTHNILNNTTNSYEYDNKDQLIEHTTPAQIINYSYDNQGNMTYKGDLGDMEYNDKNQLIKTTTPQGATITYQYDNNGNQISSYSNNDNQNINQNPNNKQQGYNQQISWTAFNKISNITANNTKVLYQYDAFNNRAIATTTTADSNKETHYIGAGLNIEQYDNKDNNISKQIISLSAYGKQIAVYIKSLTNDNKDIDRLNYLHKDAIGNIDTTTDINGNIIASLKYQAFGARDKTLYQQQTKSQTQQQQQTLTKLKDKLIQQNKTQDAQRIQLLLDKVKQEQLKQDRMNCKLVKGSYLNGKFIAGLGHTHSRWIGCKNPPKFVSRNNNNNLFVQQQQNQHNLRGKNTSPPAGYQNTNKATYNQLNEETKRGYTGHEHIQELKLINMNARIYNPTTARFKSPDTFIQNPNNILSHNRYIYALNNPYKYTDPSGHFYNFIIGAAITYITSQSENPYIRTAGMIAGGAMMGGSIGFAGGGTGLFGASANMAVANSMAAGFKRRV
jgi:RHS repeat-associated protein